MYSKFTEFVQDEDGQSLIEYSLIASVIAVGTLGAMFALRGQLQQIFNRISIYLQW